MVNCNLAWDRVIPEQEGFRPSFPMLSFRTHYGDVPRQSGLTVPGSESYQLFYEIDFEPGDEVVTLQLRMVGI